MLTLIISVLFIAAAVFIDVKTMAEVGRKITLSYYVISALAVVFVVFHSLGFTLTFVQEIFRQIR